MNAQILLVEDDLALRQALKQSLEMDGFVVDSTGTLSEARAFLQEDLGRKLPLLRIVIVDLGLPDGDGSTLLHWVRDHSALPVLIISARQDDSSKVNLLDLGADDYLVKPFSINELKARIRVALRRQSPPAADIRDLHVGELEISLSSHLVKRRGVKVHLTPTEFKLLAKLVRQSGKVVTHRKLLLEVWGEEYVEHVHYLRLYMAQLRSKLRPIPQHRSCC